jgi:serine/threonine-protein kinase CLA4
MEYMEGGSLKEASSSYTFSEPQVAYIAKETLQALKYIHKLGLVHRDLKPGNIMLTVNGVVKLSKPFSPIFRGESHSLLVDFGLCEEEHRVIRNPRMVGSPHWMPPEIILKAPYTQKVDVWSLGVTLLQLLDHKGYDMGGSFRVSTAQPFVLQSNS